MSVNLNITAQTDANTDYSISTSGVIEELIYATPPDQTFGFRGGIYAPNKKIYFIPSPSSSPPLIYVLVYDTVKKEFYRIPIAASLTFNPFFGGVIAKNGKIYCAPYRESFVLIVDTNNDTVDTTTISGIPGNRKWVGATLGKDDNVYLTPSKSTSFGIIYTETDTLDTSSITGIVGEYGNAILAENGFLYAVPNNLAANNVLILSTDTQTYDITTLSNFPNYVVDNMFSGGCIAKNGLIYLTARNSTYFLIIDPNTNTYDATSLSGLPGIQKYIAALSGADGFVYCGSSGAPSFPKIDVDLNTIDTSIINPQSPNLTTGMCNDANGVMYFSPIKDADSVMTLKTGIPKVPIKWATSAYLNKY